LCEKVDFAENVSWTYITMWKRHESYIQIIVLFLRFWPNNPEKKQTLCRNPERHGRGCVFYMSMGSDRVFEDTTNIKEILSNIGRFFNKNSYKMYWKAGKNTM
jgi:hypothetical protein